MSGNDFIRFDYGLCENNKCSTRSFNSDSKDPREAAIANYQAGLNQKIRDLLTGTNSENDFDEFRAINRYKKEQNIDFFKKYQTLPANDEELMSGVQRELPKADPNDATKPTFVTRALTPNAQKPTPVAQDAPAATTPVFQETVVTPTPAPQEAPKEAPVPTPTPVAQEAPKPEAKTTAPAKSNVRAWALSAGTSIDYRKANVNPDVGVAHPGAKEALAATKQPEPVAPPVEPTPEPTPAPVQGPQPAPPPPEKPKGIDYQITAKDRAGLSKIVAEQYVDEQGNAINLGDKAGRKESLHLALAVAKDEQNKPIAEQSKGFHDAKKHGYDTSADHIKENQTVHLAQEIEVNGKKYHLKQPPAETKPAAEPAATPPPVPSSSEEPQTTEATPKGDLAKYSIPELAKQEEEIQKS